MKDEQPRRLENHLGQLGDKVLALLFKRGPQSDLSLDGAVWTRAIKLAQREAVLGALEALGLIYSRPTGHGCKMYALTKKAARHLEQIEAKKQKTKNSTGDETK